MVGLQMFDGVGMLGGGFGVQRFLLLLLTVQANVAHNPGLEHAQIMCERPLTDECSLSVLYLNLLLDLFLFIIPLLFCFICLALLRLGVLDQRQKAVPRLVQSGAPDDVTRAVLCASGVEHHQVLGRLLAHPDDWKT